MKTTWRSTVTTCPGMWTTWCSAGTVGFITHACTVCGVETEEIELCTGMHHYRSFQTCEQQRQCWCFWIHDESAVCKRRCRYPNWCASSESTTMSSSAICLTLEQLMVHQHWWLFWLLWNQRPLWPHTLRGFLHLFSSSFLLLASPALQASLTVQARPAIECHFV